MYVYVFEIIYRPVAISEVSNSEL